MNLLLVAIDESITAATNLNSPTNPGIFQFKIISIWPKNIVP